MSNISYFIEYFTKSGTIRHSFTDGWGCGATGLSGDVTIYNKLLNTDGCAFKGNMKFRILSKRHNRQLTQKSTSFAQRDHNHSKQWCTQKGALWHGACVLGDVKATPYPKREVGCCIHHKNLYPSGTGHCAPL